LQGNVSLAALSAQEPVFVLTPPFWNSKPMASGTLPEINDTDVMSPRLSADGPTANDPPCGAVFAPPLLSPMRGSGAAFTP
jgi:hypothetical protein